MWKYNESKHQLEKILPQKDGHEIVGTFSFDHENQTESYQSNIQVLPCHESLRGKWKDGEEVKDGDFKIDRIWETNSGIADFTKLSKSEYEHFEKNYSKLVAIPLWPSQQTTERTFTLHQVRFIVSRFICMHYPKYSTMGNAGIFVNESINDESFPEK